MKSLVVLDAHTLSPLQPGESSPDHPSWDDLAEFGALTIHPRTSPGEVIARCQSAEIVLTNKVPMDAAMISALPRLAYIGVMATGHNMIDGKAARARGITVTNAAGYSTMSVAQHVFALIFDLAGHVGAHDEAVKRGDWVRCPDFCFTVAPLNELAGRTLGLVGFGAVAQAVARIGHALGMTIAVHSRSRRPVEFPVEWKSLLELLSQSDVISLHCPLTPETEHLINRETLALMKPQAWLINTGRGPLVAEDALAQALTENRLAGFAADVLNTEPPAASNPLLSAPRTIITPHIAWASVEARKRLMRTLVENVRAFLAGTPVNVVN